MVACSATDKKCVVISVFAMKKDSVTHPNVFLWGHIILEQLSECI